VQSPPLGVATAVIWPKYADAVSTGGDLITIFDALVTSPTIVTRIKAAKSATSASMVARRLV